MANPAENLARHRLSAFARRLRLTGGVPAARSVYAHLWFFPAAACLAIVAVPLWLTAYVGLIRLPAAGVDRLGHAHEMLFGYALAVVAGFLLARLSPRRLALLLAAWLVGRAAAFITPDTLTAVAGLAFPALLAAFAATPFLRAAKKSRNKVFALLLGAFIVAEALYQAGAVGVLDGGRERGVMLAVNLVALLLLLMGGRVIPAATAGALYRRGRELPARVQPRLEGAALGCMAAVLAFDLFPGTTAWAGAAALVAGLLTAVRLARWRSWEILGRPDLWGLHLGYAWLAAGLLLKGAAQTFQALPVSDALHALTIGALGTLTLVMMIRTAATRGGRFEAGSATLAVAVSMLSLAALARLAAPLVATGDSYLALLIASAVLWSAAFLRR